MVHETGLIIASRWGRIKTKRGTFCRRNAYLRVQLVDLLDRSLNVPRVDRIANLYSLLDRLKIDLGLDIGLDGKFLCRSRIAVGYEVVHDQIVDIASRSS